MLNKKVIYHAGDDASYKKYLIDTDEIRMRPMPDGDCIPYTFIHGGFPENDVKFAFFIPEKERFEGRFFQYLCPFPGPDEERASEEPAFGIDDKVAFALYHGAAYVETNMGSKGMFAGQSGDDLIIRSNCEVAELFRKIVMSRYKSERPYGYVYGGSGGGYKTMTLIEFSDCFDGAIPHVIGSPVSLPNTITMHVQGQRVLRNAFSKIIDSLEPGGNGDMYQGLNAHEAAMLKELTLMGFPPKAWFVEAMGIIDDGSFPVLIPSVKMADPEYFTDFWSKEGYEGTNQECSAQNDRVLFHTTVKEVHIATQILESQKQTDTGGVDTAWKKLLKDGARNIIELESVPENKNMYLKGTHIIIESGKAKGCELMLGRLDGNMAVLGMCFGVDRPEDVLSKLEAGDELRIDNSDYIALQYYYRHQIPGKEFHAWDQFRDDNGETTIPQRSNVFGYSMTGTGHPQDGDIHCKTMVIQALTDESTCPWCADWYRKKVIESKGSEDEFRLYYMENCMHGNEPGLGSSRTVEYMGALRQMLLDLSDWVEKGIQPIGTTQYEMVDNQVVVPDDVIRRRGIQPTAELNVDGKACVHINAGDEVTFNAKAYAPVGSGQIVKMEFSFEDSKELIDPDAFTHEGDVIHEINDELSDSATSSIKHVYSEKGTFFASVRVMTNRNASDPFTNVKNLARMRIIVD